MARSLIIRREVIENCFLQVRILLKQLDYSVLISMRWQLMQLLVSSTIISLKSRARDLISNYYISVHNSKTAVVVHT